MQASDGVAGLGTKNVHWFAYPTATGPWAREVGVKIGRQSKIRDDGIHANRGRQDSGGAGWPTDATLEKPTAAGPIQRPKSVHSIIR